MDDVRTVIYQKRFDAKSNIRYFNDLENRYARLARVLHFIGLASGSVAFLALIPKLFPSWGVPVLAAVAALAGYAVTAFGIAEAASDAKSATRHWQRRDTVWESLWLAVQSDESVDWHQLEAEMRADLEFESPQRFDAKLALRAEQDTYRALGLPVPAAP